MNKRALTRKVMGLETDVKLLRSEVRRHTGLTTGWPDQAKHHLNSEELDGLYRIIRAMKNTSLRDDVDFLLTRADEHDELHAPGPTDADERGGTQA